ncbi:MAG: hypothetical protein IJ419_02995 [Agathobacter sp.]|nr:hypothetical protein [Agathobacter sp.]
MKNLFSRLREKPILWIGSIAVIICIVLVVSIIVKSEDDIEVGDKESETDTNTEEVSETGTDLEALPMELTFGADLDHDGEDDKIILKGEMTEENTPKVSISVDVAPRYTNTGGANNRYFLVNYEGKEYLMHYSTSLNHDSMESSFRISYWQNGERVQLDYQGISTYFTEADTIDVNEWVEYSKKLNMYLSHAYLLGGFDGTEFVYGGEDVPQTFRERFTWLVAGETEPNASIETVLNLFIAQCKANHPRPTEMIMYQTVADVTHDGVEDSIQLLFHSITSEFDLNNANTTAYVKVFSGTGNGEYKSTACYVSDGFSSSHGGNGTIILTEKDGKDYFMYSCMDESQGCAEYYYKVFYVGNDSEEFEMVETIVEEGNVSFAVDPYSFFWEEMSHREDVIPAFKEKMQPWIDKGTILVALDIIDDINVSAENIVCSASEYYDRVWARSEAEELAQFEKEVGTAEWQLYLYRLECFDLKKDIENELKSDFSEWYKDYNGEKIQRINEALEERQWDGGISTNDDIIYYDADENEDVQEALKAMIEAMIIPRMEPSDIRTYTITRYAIEDSPLIQISDNMWLVEYLNGYYDFEGEDLVSMEVRLQYEAQPRPDGLVSFERQGGEGESWYVLIEENGIYRLQYCSSMFE